MPALGANRVAARCPRESPRLARLYIFVRGEQTHSLTKSRASLEGGAGHGVVKREVRASGWREGGCGATRTPRVTSGALIAEWYASRGELGESAYAARASGR